MALDGTGSEASAHQPLLAGGKADTLAARTLRRWRALVAEQTPSVLLSNALLFGILAGLVAYAYSKYFEGLLWLVWELVPVKVVLPLLRRANEELAWFPAADRVAWVYTLAVSLLFGGLAGLTQRVLGCPGDLPDTIKSIHEAGYVGWRSAPSMWLCSAFSITAGASLGPEAALLSLCGAAVSWLARQGMGYRQRSLRNCALMGMTAGLAAFFGVALGGSLFALEVLHRQGLQFYEIAVFAVACGTICLAVYRGLSGLPFGQVWTFPTAFPVVDYRHVLLGVAIGVAAAGVAALFVLLHRCINAALQKLGLHEHHTPVRSGLLGGLLVGALGVLVPSTMFWGEYEIQALADPSRPLPHIWPKGGVHGLAPFPGSGGYTAGWYLATAAAKLVAISVSVGSGFRGGFIFPLFLVGSSLGQAVAALQLPLLAGTPPVLLAMCFAASLNTAITRTPLATPLILATLCGSPQVTVPALAAALTSLYLTLHMPFIRTQRDRTDIQLTQLALPGEDFDDSAHGAARIPAALSAGRHPADPLVV